MPVLYPNDPTVPSVGTNYVSPKDPGTCPNGGICWSPTNLDSTTCGNICNRDNYTAYPLQVQFYTNALKGADQLRQRVAWALTQIFVVSQVDIQLSSWMTRYLQLFDRHAIGTFRQLLVASETRHDTDPKTLLDGAGLPGGQGAATELNEALDNIFNHPNVGPFIGAQLIQHLVTSNPGPDYVASVTSAFNTGTYTSGSG